MEERDSINHGGAYGFRDQLQDCLALMYINPEIVKNQIIHHSKHQFIEGDVEHWWHEETLRGIRTKFSDDLLWLVFLVEEYIESTGDKSILEIETNYLKGEVLKEGEDEKYDLYEEANIKESIYMHCISVWKLVAFPLLASKRKICLLSTHKRVASRWITDWIPLVKLPKHFLFNAKLVFKVVCLLLTQFPIATQWIANTFRITSNAQ